MLRSEADGRDDAVARRMPRSIGVTGSTSRAFPDNFTIDALLQAAEKQVSQAFAFLNRDLVAKVIMGLDNMYGNASTILLIVNQVLNLSSMMLSAVPFGPILPLVLQAGIAVFLAPPTRFIVKFLLFRLWEVLPARPDDQYSVSLDDKLNVLIHGQNGETNEIIAQTAAPQLFPFFSSGK